MMRIRNLISLVVFGSVLVLANISTARADGGVFPSPDYYLGETNQKAFIYYNGRTENLVILTSYRGNSKDFAWVIPTPSKPEIFKSNRTLFTSLQEITQVSDSSPGIVEDRGLSFSSPASSKPVEVIEEKTVDMYDTAVLKATDDQALAKWLTDHKFTFPANKSSSLKEYIDGGWYFTVVRIQDAFANSSAVQDQLSAGAITPLRLSFQSSRIIYPMNLTRLAMDYSEQTARELSVSPSKTVTAYSYSPYLGISLYVLADSKTEVSQLSTSWANWITPTQINQLNDSIVGENWIPSNQQLFLTKLSGSVNIKDIDNDFLITKASDNTIYPVPVYQTFSFWLINIIVFFITLLVAIFSPIGLLFIMFALLQVYAFKQKWPYLIGSIYQILACLTPIIVILALFVAMSESFKETVLTSGILGLLLGLIVLLSAGVFFTVKMLQRYQRTF